MPILIATWNLQWQFGDWEARQEPIAATLATLDADVVMVQESWRAQVEGLADRLGYHHIWAGHEPHRDPHRSMGNAILTRWPIESSAHRFLEDDHGRKYRTIVSARIDTPAGILPAFSTHLEHRYDKSATRQAQLHQASTFVEQHASGSLPPVLCGDLNAVNDSDEIRKLTGRSTPYVAGRIWSDAWELVGEGPGLTWSNKNPYLNNSAWPNRRLDYVMVGWPRDNRPVGNPVRAWLVGTEPIGGVVPSDHYGVAVELFTPNEQSHV